MSFQPGDRVRWACDDDGLPLVQYGFVGASNGDSDRVVVMLDGDLKGDTVIKINQLEPVTIANIELRLRGSDLLNDPALRQGLVNLWSAEADQAGLQLGDIEPFGPGVQDAVGGGFTLAELRSGGTDYVLRASYEASDQEIVCVKVALNPS